jgi:hypothetical protein
MSRGVTASGKVGLRFPDPLRGETAPVASSQHDFVLSEDLDNEIESADEGLQQIWPLVADAYARVWDAEGPPSATALHLATHDDTTLG